MEARITIIIIIIIIIIIGRCGAKAMLA